MEFNNFRQEQIDEVRLNGCSDSLCLNPIETALRTE